MYQYSLDQSSKKFACPLCYKRRFVKYRDNETKDYLANFVGRCDREHTCQYHYTPKQYFEEHPTERKPYDNYNTTPPPPKDLSFIMPQTMHQTLKAYESNCFVQWLNSLFEPSTVAELCHAYYIGSSNRWQGATVFWQVDFNLQVRQAKVMLYHSATGRRVKENEAPEIGKAKIYFAGKALLKKQGVSKPNLQQCFFGEHLLNKDPEKIIGIVESEKTAILMYAFSLMGMAPNYLWLATGGKYGCRINKPENVSLLAGKQIVLFPDLGAYEAWQEQVLSLRESKVVLSDILEKYASMTDREQGLDIADYFLKIYQEQQATKTNFKATEPKNAEEAKFYSIFDKKLQAMSQKNPLVTELVKRFDLVEDK
ncbi:MAG: DUF6371 domain-containing protein [Bacteroidota bacterium]